MTYADNFSIRNKAVVKIGDVANALDGLVQSVQVVEGTTLLDTTSATMADMTGITLSVTVYAGQKVTLRANVSLSHSASLGVHFQFARGGTALGTQSASVGFRNNTAGNDMLHAIEYTDSPAAGTYTYTLQWRVPTTHGYSAYQYMSATLAQTGAGTATSGNYVFSNNPFIIYADTSDGSDSKAVQITGGGAYNITGTRGSSIGSYGNEHASLTGVLNLSGGAVAAGHINQYLNHASALYRWYGASATLLHTLNNSGNLLFNVTNFSILGTATDGTDTQSITATPGSAYNITGTRGATWGVYGNEHASLPGANNITGGAVATGHISQYLNHSSAQFRWYGSSAALLHHMTNSGNWFFTASDWNITGTSSDGSDSQSIRATGGGEYDRTGIRGAGWAAFGAEHGSKPGVYETFGAAVATGHVDTYINHASALWQIYNASAAVMWTFNNSGDLSGNSSNQGDIVCARPGKGLREAVNAGIAAAGTTQGTATALTYIVNEVTSASAGVNDGVKLPTPAAGMMVIVCNGTGGTTVKVYPSSGHQINAIGADVAQSLASSKVNIYKATSTTQWWAIQGA